MLFLAVNGYEPGDTIRLHGLGASGRPEVPKVKIHTEARSLRPLDRVEVAWKRKGC
jgi:hypothetical protein